MNELELKKIADFISACEQNARSIGCKLYVRSMLSVDKELQKEFTIVIELRAQNHDV